MSPGTRRLPGAWCLVRIRLGHDLEVEVRDDGAGLPDGWRAGVGIASMRERVAELGGDVVVAPVAPARDQDYCSPAPWGE